MNGIVIGLSAVVIGMQQYQYRIGLLVLVLLYPYVVKSIRAYRQSIIL